MTLPEKIYTCRKRAGLSQEALAEKLGVSRQAVSKWETGESAPELTKLPPMAEEFGVTVDWLLSEEGFSEPAPARAQDAENSPGWVDTLPRNIRRLVRKFGWLGGLYVVLIGLGPILVGCIAKYTVHRMFSGFPEGMGFHTMAANNPVNIMASLFIVIGVGMVIVGLVLALLLRRWGKKKDS